MTKTTDIRPFGLLTGLLRQPELTTIPADLLQFSWALPPQVGRQGAYQIHVAASEASLKRDDERLWDSGRIQSEQSLHVPYEGPRLTDGSKLCWRVRIWEDTDAPSAWSPVQHCRIGPVETVESQGRFTSSRLPVQQINITPVHDKEVDDTLFLDFGRVAFGTLQFDVEAHTDTRLIIHLGEGVLDNGCVNREPPGTVRYRAMSVDVTQGQHTIRLKIPPDQRNTGPAAIKMPTDIGEVLPFRYAEIEGIGSGVSISSPQQLAAHYPFDDTAAEFYCSDPLLNQVWELCKYSIKATTFCGVYVDGDRERIPYEGDAYINQLCHYCVDREYALARYSHEYLLQFPTWPTEWQLHSVMMAYQDYFYSGELSSPALFYDDLCVKTLMGLARADGLISTVEPPVAEEFCRRLHLSNPEKGIRDLVDWPPASFGGPGERDGHVMLPVNTVVNAFHYHALTRMQVIAEALGYDEDVIDFNRRACRVKESFNRVLFDAHRGVYVDGEGSDHASLHSNMFALAFDLVPAERMSSVLDHVKKRGMACSVYGAQYLLDALFAAGEAEYAIDLITAEGDRSWRHMLEADASITWEAWDWVYKNNLDWNHAWGAAPANIIPRRLMGVRPLTPGWQHFEIHPQLGSLTEAKLRVPCIRGSIDVHVKQLETSMSVHCTIPGNSRARIILKAGADATCAMSGRPIKPRPWAGNWVIDDLPSGTHHIVLQEQEPNP